MDDATIGRVYRAVRLKKGKRQDDIATAAKVSQDTVSRVERGLIGRMSIQQLRAIGEALGVVLDINARWSGGELDRLLGARHSALHEVVAARFAGLPGWEAVPEVTFSIFGERGAIDVLAWHAATRTLLVIELKTQLVDVQELMGTMDRKRRLAPQIGAERGWTPAVVASWVILADSRTNRRRVAAHKTVLREAWPSDGRSVDAWLRRPVGTLAALSFWPTIDATGTRSSLAPVQRVRVRKPSAGQKPVSPAAAVTEPRSPEP